MTLEEVGAFAYDPDAESTESPAKRPKVDDTLYLLHNPRIPGEVKVGRARDVEARLKDLSSCQNFSLQLLWAWSGQGYLEKEVHHQLASRRLTGYPGREWFRLDPAESEVVDEIVRGLGHLKAARDRLGAEASASP